MISYGDTTFCASKVDKHTCGREFTEGDASSAEVWWGGKDYPVAYGKFCEPKSPPQVEDSRRLRKESNEKSS